MISEFKKRKLAELDKKEREYNQKQKKLEQTRNNYWFARVKIPLRVLTGALFEEERCWYGILTMDKACDICRTYKSKGHFSRYGLGDHVVSYCVSCFKLKKRGSLLKKIPSVKIYWFLWKRLKQKDIVRKIMSLIFN